MSGQYRWTEEGLYVCIRCGSGLVPGHNRKCRGKKTEAEKEEDIKTNKIRTDEKFATDLTEGFKLLDR